MKRIARLSEIERPFAGVVCDLWGVIHDGRSLFEDAVAALRALRAQGKIVAILSNSPRPTRYALERLAALGAGGGWFDIFITSGDLTRAHLEQRFPAASLFHIGEARDAVTIEGLANPMAATPEAAELLVCTGFLRGLGLDLEAHARLLEKALAAGRILLCANPDKIVPIGSDQVYCAGAIAERYEADGGNVVWLGKPAPVAYAACLARIRERAGEKVSYADLLGIGDNLDTDIQGASNLGLPSLFISDGLHGHFSEGELAALTDRLKLKPDYIMPRLKG